MNCLIVIKTLVLALPGYHNIITHCRDNSNGGGVGLFVKDNGKTTNFKDILESNKNSMKNIWTILKKAIGKQRNKLNISSTFPINNKQVSEKSEITDSFNNYFSNIGIVTSQNVPKAKQTNMSYLNKSTGISVMANSTGMNYLYLSP